MDGSQEAGKVKRVPFGMWVYLTDLVAGSIIFVCSLVTFFLASIIAIEYGDYAEPAAGMFFALTGCLYGPAAAFFLGPGRICGSNDNLEDILESTQYLGSVSDLRVVRAGRDWYLIDLILFRI
jgi:hypothetical protein